MMNKKWMPPFYLYAAGVGSASDTSYYHDVSRENVEPRRLLIKHTLSGCGTLYAGKRRLEVPAGSIFVIERPGPYVYCLEDSGVRWDFEFFSIAFTSPPGILPDELKSDPVFELSGHDELKRLLNELVILRRISGYQPSLLDSELAYRFFLTYVAIRTRQIRKPHPAAEKLRHTLISGLDNPDIDIGSRCRLLGYTPEAMIRIFHLSFGMPPGRFLQKQRLHRACELLRDERLKIKEIAALTGFSSANYFSRLFRQEFHMTPDEYRKCQASLLF